MKKKVLLLVLFMVSNMFSQQKYQSLLWKISGNNLKKDSYLYGTMHVSGKIAFRLDDVFYSSLNKSEMIALESDPTSWLENSYELLNDRNFNYPNNYNTNKDFYAELFKLQPPKDITIRSTIRLDNSLINGYLYRKRRGADNFEEETYLDMFIYQAGKKTNRPVVGLEDFDESRYLTTKARYNIAKRKADIWLQKRNKEKSRFLLTEEAYRNRNLDFLDSIGQATNTLHYRKYMLFERNRNMVEVLDSLMQYNSVFTGVGAAHLPGEEGMIEMLRSKGYEVTPLVSEQTLYGKSSKEKIEATFITPKLQLHATKDNFLTIKSFEKLREFNFLNQKYYVATDMTNGAYLAITRINTFDYLNTKSKVSLKDVDNLLFEDIPGEILKKEYFEEPYEGINILNKTKKGDYQKYVIYKTPLEIIIIKLGGKSDYVLKYGDEIFNSIHFKPINNNWIKFTPEYGKYTFSIPENYITENYNLSGKKIVQSYSNEGFYFFEEVPVHDINYIEEDKFEGSYIHKAFIKDLKLENSKINISKNDYVSYVSSTVLDSLYDKKVFLKTIVKDEIYYLLGFVGKDTVNVNKYFDSFKLKDIVYKKEFKKRIDTSLYFSVYSSAKQPFPRRYSFGNNRRKKKYESFVKRTEYNSRTNEKVSIVRRKFHDFQMFSNIDSLWKSIEKPYKKEYILTEKNKTEKNNVYTYSFLVKDSLSVKQIRVKNILKKGTLFELKTLEDSLSSTSKFVKNFYDSFTPLDTLLGESLFENKIPKFLKALRKNDSIVFWSYNLLKIKKEDVNTIVNVINEYEFPKDKYQIKNYLIEKIIELNTNDISPFLKNIYKKSYSNPQIQITIIKALIAKKETKSYNLILELLEMDFPVGSQNMSSMFWLPKSKDSLKLKRKLFPKLLELSTIPEYKKPVYGLLAQLKSIDLIKLKIYKKYKNQIYNDAKLELKRSLFNKKNKRKTSYRQSNTSILDACVNLLFPYKDERKVHLFYMKLLESEDIEALSTYYLLLEKNGLPKPVKLRNRFFKDTKNVSVLVDKLSKNKIFPKIFKTIESRQKYAQSKLFSKNNYNQERDSVSFIKKEVLKISDDIIDVYFFRLDPENNIFSNPNSSLHYIAFKNNDDDIVTEVYFRSDRHINIDETTIEKDLIDEALNEVKHKERRRLVRRRFNYIRDF